jgi:hypothetical protein
MVVVELKTSCRLLTVAARASVLGWPTHIAKQDWHGVIAPASPIFAP